MSDPQRHPAGTAHGPSAPRLSLPAWTYSNPDFFALERERVFMRSWQVVCHQNDLPAPGDYQVFDFLGEPAFVIRGEDGNLRAFYNVCRHRAARLLDSEAGSTQGNCPQGRVRCPYHAWTYDLEGRLVKVPYESAYPGLDKTDHSLPQLDLEIWRGFVFVRFESVDGDPSVADMMAPYDAELAPYRLEDMTALGRVTLRPRPVNWKNVIDNYIDGLHIAVAHTGLRRIIGRSYAIEPNGQVYRMTGTIEAGERAGWSERMYCRYLPQVPDLPPERQRLWSYYLLWPNMGFDIYPDQIDFMQMIPLSPTETLIREIPYGLPDERRETRAARYLNWRINRVVNAEDTDLIARVQAGMASRSYRQGPLSEAETCLYAFAERMRQLLPVSRLPEAPAAGALAETLGPAQ